MTFKEGGVCNSGRDDVDMTSKRALLILGSSTDQGCIAIYIMKDVYTLVGVNLDTAKVSTLDTAKVSRMLGRTLCGGVKVDTRVEPCWYVHSS